VCLLCSVYNICHGLDMKCPPKSVLFGGSLAGGGFFFFFF
jgi:hypothetical protein